MILEAYRLQKVLEIQKIQMPVLKLTFYSFIAVFFKNILPTTTGSGVVRGFYIARDTEKRTEPFAALLVIRMIGVGCLVMVTITALVIDYDQRHNLAPIYPAIFLFVIFLFVIAFFTRRKVAARRFVILRRLKNKTFGNKIVGACRVFHTHLRFPRKLCLAVAITFAIQFIYITINFLVAKDINFNTIRPGAFFIFIPLISVSAIIPSLGGLGIREVMYVYFFSNILGKEGAGALGMIMLVLTIILATTGGIIFAISGSLRKARAEFSNKNNAVGGILINNG